MNILVEYDYSQIAYKLFRVKSNFKYCVCRKFKIQGERPFKKGPSFVKNRIGIHKVPVSIEMAMTSGGDITKEDAKDALLECVS